MLSRFVVLFALLCTIATAAEQQVYPFKRLVVASNEPRATGAKVTPTDAKFVYDEDIPLLAGADFRAAIAPFIGKPISSALVNELSNAIVKFGHDHDRLITKVLIPNQNASDGTIRFVVVFGHFKDLAVRGNRWFSSKLLEQQLGVKPGDEVRLSVLEQAVNWANTNPFRQVKVLVNDIANQPGSAELLVGVQEAWPWRFSASVDDYGNDILGNRHYTAGVQFGNLWGLDHQGSYQYVTTDDSKVYQAHVFDYRIPLAWRHFIEVSGSYVQIHPVFGNTNQFTQTGKNEVADLKYTIPIRNGENPIEVHAGLDFKRGNNNLEYAGFNVYGSDTDTFQFTTGGSVVTHDHNNHGAWVLGATVNISPGNIDRRNNDATYQATRFGSKPSYIYGDVSLQRLQALPHGWEISSRLIGQVSSTNLLGSEQLTIGGATSVRGFNTNVFAGDQGFIFNNDLQSPILTTSLAKLGKKVPPLQTRFVVFYDAGDVSFKHHFGFDPGMKPLASAGVGLRMSVATNFSLNFDYGWQITRLPYVNNEHARGHIKVVLAF